MKIGQSVDGCLKQQEDRPVRKTGIEELARQEESRRVREGSVSRQEESTGPNAAEESAR